MCRRLSRACLCAALLGCFSLGCSSRPIVKKNPPPDPLLMSKTPIQARFGATTDQHPRPDPSAPVMPATAWANPPSPIAHLGIPDGDAGAFRVTAEKRDTRSAKDGNLAFPVLQGSLEKSANGEWVMRCEPGTPMPSNGVVLLEGHPRLDLFETGTVIRVEGRIVEEGNGRNAGSWLPHPRYHVDRVDLIHRGN